MATVLFPPALIHSMPRKSTQVPAPRLSETISVQADVEIVTSEVKKTLDVLITPPAPAGPVGPVGPVAPAAPVAPAGPVGPAGPVAPVAPAAPVAPVAPVAPLGPAKGFGPKTSVTVTV